MRKRLGFGLGVVAAVVLSAAGVATAGESPRDPWADVPAAAPARPAPVSIGVAGARRVAVGAVAGGRVVQIESDGTGDHAAWKVWLDAPGGLQAVLVDDVTGTVTPCTVPR